MLFSREIIKNRLLLFCGVIPLLIFTAGCGGDSKSGPTGPGGGSGVLFQDDFSNSTLSNDWTPTIFGGGAIGIDTGTGQPSPSLYIQSDSTWVAQSIVVLSQPYNNAGGVIFTIQVEVDNPGRAGVNLEGIRVVIHDQGRNTAIAGVTFRRYTDGSENLKISYDVYPAGFPFQLVEENNLALSVGFHEFQFTVYPDLTAKWTRDGIQRLATLTGVQLAEADLQLHLNVRGVDAAAHFDNALVSR